MDAEKSLNSSFGDLSKTNESTLDAANGAPRINGNVPAPNSTADANDGTPVALKGSANNGTVDDETADDDVCDILGNKQLTKRIIKKSERDQKPVQGDLVTVEYTARLEDGRIVEEKRDLRLHVGDSEVVQGVDITLPMMYIGEVSELVITPRFAYGTIGLQNTSEPEKSVPPNATLIYTIELLNVEQEDFADLKTFEIRRRYGNGKKERANFWYNRGEYNTAIRLYRRALEYLDNRDGDPDSLYDKEDLELSKDDARTLLEDRLIVYNNLAMAQIKVAAYDAALNSVENVLRCQPDNPKALYRKGRILDAKGDTKGAIELTRRAAQLEPENRIIQQDLAKLLVKARREEHNEKELYQKMLGQSKKAEPTKQATQPRSGAENSNFKVFSYLIGSVLVAVAGVAIYRYSY